MIFLKLRQNHFLILLLIVFSFGMGIEAKADVWEIDGLASRATFKVKHWGLMSVTGTIGGVSGEVRLVGDELQTVKINASLSPSTINTENLKRDKHLKSPDYFGVDKFPSIRFVSTKMTQGKGGKWILNGDLSMHGKTNKVDLILDKISLSGPNKNGKIIRNIQASGTLNRQDFGITGGGMLIGNNVNITLDIQLVRQMGR